MSDGNYQQEGRLVSKKTFLPFEFEGEIIEPEQYLAWHKMREEYEFEENMRDYEKIK